MLNSRNTEKVAGYNCGNLSVLGHEAKKILLW
jgi:hypothetical protein